MPKLFSRFFKKSAAMIGVTQLPKGWENPTDVNNLNSYKESLYLYIGVSMIAKRVAGIPLELYKIKNKRGDVQELFEHPLLELFSNPNEMETQREFTELSVAYYLLSGDCFWYLDRNGSKIEQMVALRPDLIEILLSPDKKRIVGYEYRASTVVTFKPEDVLHIKNIDPSNPLRGVGIVRPATSRILTEIEATKYQANFFQNQGRPDMAVFASKAISPEDATAARKTWRDIFGRGKGGQVAFFGNDVTKIEELNKTPKEMDFIGSQKFLRDDILAALHIPKAMVTSDDVNLANAKEAYKMYLQEAVVPVFEAFLDVINNKLVPQVDEAVFFDFEDPTPADREMILKETSQLKRDGIITANEAREVFGYEALEGADQLSAAANNNARIEVQEEAKRFIRRRPSLAKRLDAMEKMLATLTAPKREMNSIFANKAMKEGYAKAFNEKVDRKAEILKGALDAFHKEMQDRILASEFEPSGFMDVGREKSLAKKALTPIMVKLYTEGGQEALDAVFKKAEDRFFADEVLLSAIEGRVAFFTSSMVDTSFDILKSKIVAGIAAGDGPDKIGRDIRSYFEDMSVSRGKTIARTETGFALSKATNDAYNQSSVITGKEWITAGDSNVRDEHVENDGVIVATGGSFPSGESYPAEHSINCRCVLAPAV
jgi:HK97 family phage portal protein